MKYRGLKLIGSLLIFSSIIISIFTIIIVGSLAADSIQNKTPFDAIQALYIVVIGFIVALFLYAFAQVTDIHIRNYSASRRIIYEIVQNNQLNNQILELLAILLDVRKEEIEIAKQISIDDIQEQIAARRVRLQRESEEFKD